jgi:hypothetical protein
LAYVFLNQLMRKLLIEGQIAKVEGEPLSELKLLKQPPRPALSK